MNDQIIVGEWYFTKRSHRIICIQGIDQAKGRAAAFDVENTDNRGWVYLTSINPDNRGVNEEYNMRHWQPNYPIDEYLEE